MPFDHEDTWDDYHQTTHKGGWKHLERKCVKQILKEFPECKLISKDKIINVEIDLDRFEIIAFRIRRKIFFGDFHFMRCERNGDWTEKQGSWHQIYQHNYEDIFDIWGEYDGKLYFFIRKRQA